VSRRLAAAACVLAVVVWGSARLLVAQSAAPEMAQLTLTLAASGVHPGESVRGVVSVHLPEGFHAQSNAPKDPAVIPTRLTFEPVDGITETEVVFPKTTDIHVVGFDDLQPVFERDFAIGVAFKIAPDAAIGSREIPIHLRYQACNDVKCMVPVAAQATWTLQIVAPGTSVTPANADLLKGLPFGHGTPPPAPTAQDRPRKRAAEQPRAADLGASARLDAFTAAGTASGYLSSTDFLQFVHDAESGVKRSGMFEGRGPLAILLIVFVGGLALNLTPCVLPMIPINLAIIGAGARAGNKQRGFLLGATYGAAMALSYGLLGLAVILTAGSFGTINASPWFNVAIAVLFVFLGLAMFDIVTLDFSKFSSGIQFKQESRGSLLLAFGMGAVAAILAGACVAPVVVQVVLFSSNLYATGTKVALALPFVLGLGMALPWPAAGAGMALLPKPGKWMERVKYVFGVFILASAAYYGYLAYELFSSRWVDPSAVRASVEDQLKSGWHASLDEGLEEAQRTGHPVLIDMWATWCKNCLTMDRTTLLDTSVTGALSNYVKVKFQAEDPDDPTVKAVMQRFGAVGLPTYVVLQVKK
jgi:cytochrome c biogenesis protein CcdA/thiol-disulfide isomerase/thioredoxin